MPVFTIGGFVAGRVVDCAKCVPGSKNGIQEWGTATEEMTSKQTQ